MPGFLWSTRHQSFEFEEPVDATSEHQPRLKTKKSARRSQQTSHRQSIAVQQQP